MKLRPHHLLDIISAYGFDTVLEPHPYGHAVHTVAQTVLPNVEMEVEFIVGADDICKPCKHLQPNGLCDDTLYPDTLASKQEYNDAIDRRLFAYLGFNIGTIMTIRQFLCIVNEKVPGIETICTHPKEDHGVRLDGLIKGLRKIGIRK